MDFNITVKRKFKINGKEYNSMEEMPDDIREKFKKMMDSLADSGNQANSASLRSIAFNAVLGAAKTPAASPTIDLTKPSSDKQRELGALGTVHISQPTKVEPSFSVRILIVIVTLGALLYLLYYLWQSIL